MEVGRSAKNARRSIKSIPRTTRPNRREEELQSARKHVEKIALEKVQIDHTTSTDTILNQPHTTKHTPPSPLAYSNVITIPQAMSILTNQPPFAGRHDLQHLKDLDLFLDYRSRFLEVIENLDKHAVEAPRK